MLRFEKQVLLSPKKIKMEHSTVQKKKEGTFCTFAAVESPESAALSPW